MGVAVTFIAILELLRESVIEVAQADAFAPLHVRAASTVRLVSDNEDAEAETDEEPAPEASDEAPVESDQ